MTAPETARRQAYFDLLGFIVSNAIAGEIMAVDNYTDIASLAPDEAYRAEALEQAEEERKHQRMLASLGRSLSIPIAQQIVEPQWLRVRKHFQVAVERNNLAACLIIQDLMVESMAIVLYRLLSGEADADPQTATVAGTILEDELEHWQIGVDRIQALRAENPHDVDDALVFAHHRVMPELFSLVSTRCESLCDVLGISCDSLDLADLATDIDQLRAQALEQYVSTLDAAGFPGRVTNPLVASMTAYEGFQPARAELGADAPPRCC